VTDQLTKCAVFSELHKSKEAWVIPNPWDVGSAKLLEGLGFKALATTSSGFAYTLGRVDGEVSLEEKLEHCRLISSATDIPLNADFEKGFCDNVHVMADNIKRVIETGIAGCSIEDYSRESKSLYEFSHAVERVAKAAEVIATTGIPVVLTARSENLLRGVDDVEDTVKRLQAFSAAGADVLYAPGINSLELLSQITAELNKPFNVLASFIPSATVTQFSQAGATRISVGGSLNYAAINPLLIAGNEILTKGTFNWLAQAASGAEVRTLLQQKK
jgi:2-methylisocitrate lyase-like PEP mutase family enzyme